MQACLAYINFSGISNSDIREVFGLTIKEKAKATRIIQNTMDEGLIKILNPDTAPRYIRYVPFWV